MKLTDSTAAETLWEMADLSPRMTGVPYNIFISPDYGVGHEARVKVSNNKGKIVPNDMFVVRLHDLGVEGECKLKTDDLERVKWWVHRNRFVLLDYWKNRIDTDQCLAALKPITENEIIEY